ncbi:MAG: thermonuclease family protein [Verrucomicrobia bacterium]|nr:thermonuclease family protein [Verrucomicrobiota bacterium]
MVRLSRVVASAFLVALLVTGASGEIVKVTAEKARFYDAETKELKTFNAKGKRFLVYSVQKDWYLVEATINKEKKLVWLAMADAAIDWSDARTARVAGVVNTSTLKLDTGQFVQFAGIVVTRDDTTLTRQTYEWLKGLLEGKEVVLELEASGDQGTPAAYVYVGGLFVNRALVEYGAATVAEAGETAERYAPVFDRYAAQARQEQRGIWAPTEPAATTGNATPAQGATGPARKLTQAELTQWSLRLQVNVAVRTEKIKTGKDADEICLRYPVRNRLPESGPPPEIDAAIITAA